MTTELKTYYRAVLQYSERCCYVDMAKWYVIQETKCYVYVLPEFQYPWADMSYYAHQRQENETDLQLAKRLKLNVKKVHKERSRFAFDTEEKAFKRLEFIKRYHVRHLRNQLQLVESFLENANGCTYEEFQSKTSIKIEGIL